MAIFLLMNRPHFYFSFPPIINLLLTHFYNIIKMFLDFFFQVNIDLIDLHKISELSYHFTNKLHLFYNFK